MTSQTLVAYQRVLSICEDIFKKKHSDYGPSWLALDLMNITDLINAKVTRIRTISIKKTQQVADDIPTELIGIINYALMALMRIDMGKTQVLSLPDEELAKRYSQAVQEAEALMLRKNHDYGDAWRTMRPSSFINLMATKILRIKSIEDNQGTTLISEGVVSNYQDILNYAVFAFIQYEGDAGTEKNTPPKSESSKD